MKSTAKCSMTHAMLLVVCWCGYTATSPPPCQAASVEFDWDLVASDVHPTLKYFPSATSANVFGFGPFKFLQGALGTANSIAGLPTILNSLGGDPTNLTFEFGNFFAPLARTKYNSHAA